jgi:hypothetical protein
MNILRKTLGVTVMIAGILGVIIALAGIIGVWAAKPTVEEVAVKTVSTLKTSLDTSQQVMEVTKNALGGTIDSVNALQTMLTATAASVTDTQPLLEKINTILGETLPNTLTSAADSLVVAQQGAQVIDSAIRSFDTFKSFLGSVPLIGGFISGAPSEEPYNPDRPLYESLGDVATNLQGLPATFTGMSESLNKADDNLVTIEESLSTMATSVGTISSSLEQYQTMIGQSQQSMKDLLVILGNVSENLSTYLTIAAVILTVFLAWLLIAQIVILTQGYELFKGTADKID